ncbi:MAG TPA: hypothetical protein VFR67_10575 [Pilimelia sp.]|nr:hypothetical protein [Pilimelia sp.]
MGSPRLSEATQAATEPISRGWSFRWIHAAAGAALLAVVAIGLLVMGLIPTGRSGNGGGAPAADPAEVLAAADGVRGFVERERGLRFDPPIRVRVLAGGDFDRFAAEVADTKTERGRANAEKTQGVLVALGLLPAGTDLLGELRALGESTGRVALYDVTTGTLAVRAVAATPYARVQMARELTYALLDQRFGLDRPQLANARDGSGFAFTALVSGDVARVTAAYRSSLPDPEQAQVAGEEGRIAGRTAGLVAERRIPPVVSRFAALPSQAGSALVEAILADGGQRALDEAFSDPPVNAAQVLFPDRYLNRRAAATVPVPRAEGQVFDEGVFGSDHLLYLLGETPTAQAAMRGWGGDRYVAWRDGDRRCVRVAFVGDTPHGIDELADALVLWVASRPEAASVTRPGDRVVLSACGPRP